MSFEREEPDVGMAEFEAALCGFRTRHAALFQQIEAAGWIEGRRVAAERVAREPYWDTPFPRHALAEEFLTAFSGVRGRLGTWHHLRLGCAYVASASSLTETLPYDLETLVLGEHDYARPPAFPIGTVDGWMLFLREDWSTLTVNYKWRDVLLSDDPFAVLDEFRTDLSAIWDDRARHIEIDDERRVPMPLLGSTFDS